ncbi:MAG: hypothetical protein M0Z52_05210 [Actinomycetota bacterium]|nr:hypothetical protein [Actinomycetota bacterium]
MVEKIRNNPYEYLMPRLEGSLLAKSPAPYLELVKKGVCGFILFDGELEEVREGISLLQEAGMREAGFPLLIASDLERGLGQQVRGGTVFPPAMAFGQAYLNGFDELKIRKAFNAIAVEALWAGINLIFAPVLDVNSNPLNPIIATRAFGEDTGTVSGLGVMMIEEFQGRGVMACGKHFPGHGDTHLDSHLTLPSVDKQLGELHNFELLPFKEAVNAGVKSLMFAHLSVPAIEPSAIPVSLSKNAVKLAREGLGFKGLIFTDAMNMGGINIKEQEAAAMALKAGVDVLLHPSSPDEMAKHLSSIELPEPVLLRRIRHELTETKRRTGPPDFRMHEALAQEIAFAAIRYEGSQKSLGKSPVVIILSDDPEALSPFVKEAASALPGLPVLVNPEPQDMPRNKETLAVIHSVPRAWRPPPEQLKRKIEAASELGPLWLSFGNPYAIHNEKNKILAYSDSEAVQREMARRVLRA